MKAPFNIKNYKNNPNLNNNLSQRNSSNTNSNRNNPKEKANPNQINNAKNNSKENRFFNQKSNISNLSTTNSNRQTLENNISNLQNAKNNYKSMSSRTIEKNSRPDNLGNTIFKGQKFIGFQEPFNESIRPIKPQSRDFDDNKNHQQNKFLHHNNMQLKNVEDRNNLQLIRQENNLYNENEEYQVIEDYSGCSEEEDNENDFYDNQQEQNFKNEQLDFDNFADSGVELNSFVKSNNAENDGKNVNHKSLAMNKNGFKEKFDLNIEQDKLNKKRRENSMHYINNVLLSDRSNNLVKESDDLIRKSKYFSNLKIPGIDRNARFNTPEIKRALKYNLNNYDNDDDQENRCNAIYDVIDNLDKNKKNPNNQERNKKWMSFNPNSENQKETDTQSNLQTNPSNIQTNNNTNFSPGNSNNNNQISNSKNITIDNTAKFNFKENFVNLLKNESKNFIKANTNKDNKDDLEEFIFNNLNKFNKEILTKDSYNKNMQKAVEVMDLNHFQQIMLYAEKAINPDFNKKEQKDPALKTKENNLNANNVTNFSSIPVDEYPNQNLNFNSMKETNNMDFINILMQLKSGQKNEDEKNKNFRNTITRIDDDSQSYIKDILEICSDDNNKINNNNNLNKNGAKFPVVSNNPSDMNTINLNNFEIINSNQQVLQRHFNEMSKHQNLNDLNNNNNLDDYTNCNLVFKDNYQNNPTLKQNHNFNNNNYNNNNKIPNNYNDSSSYRQNSIKFNEKTDSYFNNTPENQSDSKQINMRINNPAPGFNGKTSQTSNKNRTTTSSYNNQSNLKQVSSNKLETNDLIEITNRRKNLVNDISSVDGYFRRRHLETLAKMEKIKKEKFNQEKKENNHIPKINKKSKEIVNRICGGSFNNAIVNPVNHNKVKAAKGANYSRDNIEIYYENVNDLINYNHNNLNNLSNYSQNRNEFFGNENNIVNNNINNDFYKNSNNQENLMNSQPDKNLNFNNRNMNVNSHSILRELEDLLENEKEQNNDFHNQAYSYNNHFTDTQPNSNYIKLPPKSENKRHKSAGNTRVLNNADNWDHSNPNPNNFYDDNHFSYGNKISFDPNNEKVNYALNNFRKQANYPIINFEINNNVYNPEPNSIQNQNFPIENAIRIKKDNFENNKRKLQLEVPEAKNYVMTSADIVNYGTKTNKTKPVNDLKNIFNNSSSNLNTILRSGDKNDPNNLNTIESITRKFMFSCENNFQEFKPETQLDSIDNKKLDGKFNSDLRNSKQIAFVENNQVVPIRNSIENLHPKDSQVKSSVDHVEIDIFNTDISISRISTHQKDKQDLKPINYQNQNHPTNTQDNDIDVGLSASKTSIQLFPVNEKTDADLNFNMEVFTNETKKNKLYNKNSNLPRETSNNSIYNINYNNSYSNNQKQNLVTNVDGKLIYNRNQNFNNTNNINNTNQTETIYNNLNTNSSRDADTINRLNTDGTVNANEYNPQKTLKNLMDNSEILQAFSEKNNQQNKSTAINMNSIPEINNINKKNKIIPIPNNNNNYNVNSEKSNLIFNNNSDLASVSDINRNNISPMGNKNESNPRNVTNISNINQNNQSINFSKFTNFVGNSNLSNHNITNNLTQINNNNFNQNTLNNNTNLNNQINVSNFKNIKRPNIPKIFSGGNYYQNIINNTTNKTCTTNISNKNMVQSYLSTERNEKMNKRGSNNNDGNLIDDNSDLNFNRKNNNVYLDNNDNSNLNPVKPLVNLSISCDEKEFGNFNNNVNFKNGNVNNTGEQKDLERNYNKSIKNNNEINFNKHNFFDSDKFIFSSKAADAGKKDKVFNFNYHKINDFLTNDANEQSKYGGFKNTIQDRNLPTQLDDTEQNIINNMNLHTEVAADKKISLRRDSNKNNDHYYLGISNIPGNNNFIEIEDQGIYSDQDYYNEPNHKFNNHSAKNKNSNNDNTNNLVLDTKKYESGKLINPKYNNFKMNIFEKINKNPFLPNNVQIKNNININIKNPTSLVETNHPQNENTQINNFTNNNNNRILQKNNSVKSMNYRLDSKKSIENKSIHSHERYAGVETEANNNRAIFGNANYLNINSIDLNKRKLSNQNKLNQHEDFEVQNKYDQCNNEFMNIQDRGENEDNNFLNVETNLDSDNKVCYNAVINLDESEMPSNMNNNVAEQNNEVLFYETNNQHENRNKKDLNFNNAQNKQGEIVNRNTDRGSKNNQTSKNKLNKINKDNKIKENKVTKENNNIKSNRKPNSVSKNVINKDPLNKRKKLINKADELNPKYHKSLNLPNKKPKLNNNNIPNLIKSTNQAGNQINNNEDQRSAKNFHNKNKKFNTMNIGEHEDLIYNNFYTSPENNFIDSLNNSFNKEFENILDDEKFYNKKNESCDFSYSYRSVKNDLKNLEKIDKVFTSTDNKNKEINNSIDEVKRDSKTSSQNFKEENEEPLNNKSNNKKEEFIIQKNNFFTAEGLARSEKDEGNLVRNCNYDTAKFSIEVKNSENFNSRLKTEDKEEKKIKLETLQEMNDVISKSVKLQRISQENCQLKIKSFLDRLQTKQENQEKNVLNDIKDLNFTETSLIKSANSSFRNEVEQDLENFLKKISP